VVGELHPRIVAALDLPARTSAFELRLDARADATDRPLDYREVPRFPPVRRDLAFVVDQGAAAARVEAAIRDSGGELLDEVVLFDVFTGDPVPPGRKSLAFSLALRAPDRTLTDQEAEGAVGAIVDRVHREFGADLRS
jgi:phenylalanyl-tRNA synthetase beta chain